MIKNIMVKLGTAMASLALVVGVATESAACHWFFHQPKVPQGMKKFRKQ